ncbi:CSC1-like protein At3g54510 isoform X3 [Juglans microcarpa x Juglans regia]|uniref:CSC1-like protein At3g54510 isoform X3 n=1 Tax=Juglans microcarpa x Juglans regia TaxID=2249226 RepID=UPI001B7EBAD0|nr:CSC1-like protein At3g54510 isoform X3 [Juglans microcarpa x Juglans regia]
MNTQSLFASAAINIGLAFVVLSLFAILKKQPSNAPIYYARRLSKGHNIHFHHSLSIHRFFPSVSWIPRAFRVTEDEILETGGLDALVIIRLFKFGIKFFVVCSLVGLAVLIPVNYNGQDGSYRSYHSMDSFTISNISRGSNRLWVHFSCLWFISLYGLYLLYEEYNGILVKRIQQLRKIRHRPDQFTILVREIPFCTEHKARGCYVDHFFSKHHPYTYHAYQMLYDGKDVEVLLSQAESIARKIKDLREGPMANKHKRERLLLDASQEYAISLQQEKLQVFCEKIRQLQREIIIKQKELPVAFVIFKSRWGAALAAQSQQHPHPLLWITEMAPEPRDVSWRSLVIPYRILWLYKIGVVLAASVLTIFFAIPVTAVQGIARFEKLKKWFPPAMAVQLIPGLSSILTGYLPSVILKGFIYIVPFAMLGMAKAAGCISKSKEEIKACNMVFYFLVGNVFFLSVLSGSLLDEIGESFTHPKDFPSHLAGAVSAQADFFMTYILTDGLSGFSLEILQPGLLFWDVIKSITFGHGKKKNPYLYSLPYFRIIPMVSLSVLIGTVYAVVAPFLLPFLIGYFSLGYAVYVNQIEDVYETVYETCGQYWPYIHLYIVIAIILMQITMIGLFGLKSKPAASILTIPLLLFTLMFNEYCKKRFLPTFHHYPVQAAAITWQDLFSLVISNFLITFVLSLWVEKAGLLAFRCTSNLQFALQKLFFLDGLNLLQLFFLDGLSVF